MLFDWMKSLIIYLIFAGAIINLSPSGNYKKYIRLFTGLIAIIILLNPIAMVFNYDSNQLYGLINSINYNDSLGLTGINNELIDYYDLSLSEVIKSQLVDRGFSVEAVNTITDQNNNLLSCNVFLDASSKLDASFEENNIKSLINEFYNLDIDNIYVVRR